MDARLMPHDEVYREELPSIWGWLGPAFFFAIAVLMAVFYFIQRTSGPIGSDPEPGWFYLAMAAFYLILGILIINFTKLTVSAGPKGITAAYGRFSHFEPWDNIESVARDERSTLRYYGGWGIRFGRKDGGSVLVYNTTGASLLLLRLKQGKRKYFGFSTKRPDEVTALVNKWK